VTGVARAAGATDGRAADEQFDLCDPHRRPYRGRSETAVCEVDLEIAQHRAALVEAAERFANEKLRLRTKLLWVAAGS